MKKTQQLVIQEHPGWGGSKFDAQHLTNFFNYDAPHHFGMMTTKLFSATNRFPTKILNALTEGSGRVYYIDSDIYRWTLTGDDTRKVRISAYVEGNNARIGYGREAFKIVLDEPWFHVPDVIMLEDNRFMLTVESHPVQVGSSYEYTVKLQTGDPNAFITSELLQPGRTVSKVSTMLSDANNQEYGTFSWGSQVELESFVGTPFGNHFKVDDKLIRKELAKKKGGPAGVTGALSREYPYTGGITWGIWNKGQQYTSFLTFAEMKVFEETYRDREWAAHFSQGEIRQSPDGRAFKRRAPGFRQLVRDGHEFYHNGSLNAQQLQDFIMALTHTRVDESNRHFVFDTGTLGAIILDQLLSDEASAFLTVDTNYIRPMEGGKRHELEFGYQFKKFVGKNGVAVTLFMNPMKDDPEYCPRMHPHNPIYTVDSARMDVYDIGNSKNSLTPDGSNICMIKQNGLDEYYYIGGIVDMRTGLPTDGRTVQSYSKEVEMRFATTGSINFWDTSRIGAIIYDPEYTA